MNESGSPQPDERDALTRLALRALDGDADASTALVADLRRHLCPWFRRSGVPAEDGLQETLIRFFRSYDPARSAAKTFAFRVAKNVRADHLRRESRRIAASSATLGPELDGMVAQYMDAACENEELLARLKRTSDRFSEAERGVLMLRLGRGHEYAHIARELGIEPKAARRIFHQVIKELSQLEAQLEPEVARADVGEPDERRREANHG